MIAIPFRNSGKKGFRSFPGHVVKEKKKKKFFKKKKKKKKKKLLPDLAEKNRRPQLTE